MNGTSLEQQARFLIRFGWVLLIGAAGGSIISFVFPIGWIPRVFFPVAFFWTLYHLCVNYRSLRILRRQRIRG